MSLIEVRGKCRKKYKFIASSVAEKVISIMGFPDNLEVAIEFVSAKDIRRLNANFRDVDKVTDVLSFPAFQIEAGLMIDLGNKEVIPFNTESEFVHFGDMALCLKQTKKQAKEFGVSLESEIKKLVIHSMLHLMGYDHIDDNDYLKMNEQEKKLDKLIEV